MKDYWIAGNHLRRILLFQFLYIPLVLLLQQGVPHAAMIDLSGTVVNGSMEPIAGAAVTLYTRNNLQTQSDAQGQFRLIGDAAVSVIPSPKRYSLGNPAGSGPSSVIVHGALYNLKGTKVCNLPAGSAVYGSEKNGLTERSIAAGVYLMTWTVGRINYMATIVVSRDGLHAPVLLTNVDKRRPGNRPCAQISEFSDILVVSSSGNQTVRRSVTTLEENGIVIKLMPDGVGNVTPSIPVFSDDGGEGDVTTYGSVSDPEASQGGACNYGTTAIRYYAAINVSQLPSDLQGQWQNGQVCGRCARVSIRTKEGTIRTTTVRIVDKCPDDHCGIDLGGAPAGELMGTQPGRYYGEWEWVPCTGVEGVSDGTPSLNVKAGSNTWWSLVQMRNGPGAVMEMRVRKVGTTDWQILPWATEAENYFSVPVDLLQDSDDWEVAIIWSTGTSDTLRVKGSALAVENAAYPLQ